MIKLNPPEGLTDKNTVHSYLPIYEQLFMCMREDVKTVVEIGVDGGGSLIMWQEYFPNAQIIGMDINPKPPAILGHDRINHLQQNAYASNFGIIAADIIIDDGSHFLENQIFFVKYYTHILKEHGLLIVEDVQDISHIKKLADALPEGFNHACIDLRTVKDRYDDILFVAWKKL